jgi:outer membrane biosynthesis protein TonB
MEKICKPKSAGEIWKSKSVGEELGTRTCWRKSVKHNLLSSTGKSTDGSRKVQWEPNGMFNEMLDGRSTKGQQTTKQPTHQPTKARQPNNRLTNQTTDSPTKQTTHQPRRKVQRKARRKVNKRPNNRLTNQQPTNKPTTNQQPTTNNKLTNNQQPTNQTTKQPTSQPNNQPRKQCNQVLMSWFLVNAGLVGVCEDLNGFVDAGFAFSNDMKAIERHPGLRHSLLTT